LGNDEKVHVIVHQTVSVDRDSALFRQFGTTFQVPFFVEAVPVNPAAIHPTRYDVVR
jgi:hypothetical protein